MRAMYTLLSRKYQGGKRTPRQIIFESGGWTPGNLQAAQNIAKSAGIGLDDDIGLTDPVRAQRFMRGLLLQEHGPASNAYTDKMLAAAITSNPALAQTLATRPANPGDPGLNTPATRLPASTPVSGMPQPPSFSTGAPAPPAAPTMVARDSDFQMPDMASYYNRRMPQAPPGIMQVTQPGPYDPNVGTRQQKLIEALMSNLGGGGLA